MFTRNDSLETFFTRKRGHSKQNIKKLEGRNFLFSCNKFSTIKVNTKVLHRTLRCSHGTIVLKLFLHVKEVILSKISKNWRDVIFCFLVINSQPLRLTLKFFIVH